jgi:hypothetical protein
MDYNRVMPEPKIKYANFPEHGFKVVIGPNINAVTTKALGRLSIGTYEMSFVQQERGATTGEAARIALTHIARPLLMTVTSESHRDYVCCLSAANAEHRFQVWVTTPFELTQDRGRLQALDQLHQRRDRDPDPQYPEERDQAPRRRTVPAQGQPAAALHQEGRPGWRRQRSGGRRDPSGRRRRRTRYALTATELRLVTA